MYPSHLSLRAGAALLATSTALLLSSSSRAQSAPAPKPGGQSLACPINTAPPSAADIAFSHSKFDAAADLYRKDAPTSDRAHNGLIRSLLAAGKVTDAASDANDWAAKSPTNSWALASVGEVQLREASIDKAVASIQAAGHADHCNMQVHYDFAKFSELTGMYATAKRHLDLAHTYEPTNLEISEAWVDLQPRAVRLADVIKTLETDKTLTDKEKKWLEKRKEFLASPAESCRPSSPVGSATIPIHGIKDGPGGKVEWGLIVGFNGKDRRMEIDTGASGLLLSHSAATAMHLTPDFETSAGGLGDDGATKSFITKVDKIKIGGLQFENCNVEVMEKDPEGFQEIDGLIGGDVFSDFLLTLDFPGRQIKLDPLPAVPSTNAAAGPALDTGTKTGDRPVQDAYIDPTMQNWTAVDRIGHLLILPVRLNEKSTRLFVLDTGADTTMINISAAREVTKVQRSPDLGMYGVSGEIKDTYLTGDIKLDFAGLRYPAHDLVALDTGKVFHDDIEISGLIGAGILRQLTMRIDYRDDLVNFTYDPKRLTHCIGDVYREDCYQ